MKRSATIKSKSWILLLVKVAKMSMAERPAYSLKLSIVVMVLESQAQQCSFIPSSKVAKICMALADWIQTSNNLIRRSLIITKLASSKEILSQSKGFQTFHKPNYGSLKHILAWAIQTHKLHSQLIQGWSTNLPSLNQMVIKVSEDPKLQLAPLITGIYLKETLRSQLLTPQWMIRV